MKIKAIMVRLEGTLTNDNRRLASACYQLDQPQNYFTEYHDDTINEWCVDLVKKYSVDHKIIFYSNHPEKMTDELEDFIAEKTGLKFTQFRLLCVNETDKRRNYVSFEQMYIRRIKPKYDVLLTIEQRLNVCRIWRQQNLVSLHNTERQI